MSGRSKGLLIVFLALVAAVAFAAAQVQPGPWYEGLAKPSWNPPNWLFGPVWTVLYGMIAVAGWWIWTTPVAAEGMRAARWLWAVQMVLNGLWSYLFFGLHQMGIALVDIALLVAVIAALIAVARRSARLASWLLVPYLAWVSYATSLNAALWWLNR